jgi:two-component system chemotaxis response regulator CheY
MDDFKKPAQVAKNIWIVDKDSALRSTLTRQLEIWGYNVSTFSSSKDAYARVQVDTWPDVFLHETDFRVDKPRDNQFELLKYILDGQQSNKFSYFVYLVAQEQEDEARLAIETGAHEIIEKPIRNMEAFRSRIDSFARYVNIIRTIEDKNNLINEQFEKLSQIHTRTDELLYTVKEAADRKTLSEHLSGTLYKTLTETLEASEKAHHYFKEHVEPVRAEKERQAKAKKDAKNIIDESKKKKVLIADDNKSNRKLLVGMLKKKFVCTEAENGKVALETFEQAYEHDQPFDLVLLDIVMPEVTGREALVKMRSFEDMKKIKQHERAFIAMMTSLDDRESMMNSHQEGCNQYIVKPFSKEKLDKILQKV